MTIRLERVREAIRGRNHRSVTPREGDRHAAVAAILRERGEEAEVLLIRRALQPGDPWSGHMAFPGGRHEPNDHDLLETAVRETSEEVGVVLHPDRHLLGRLDDLPAMARGKPVGMIITPFVFELDEEPTFARNVREVEEVLWAPLAPLARGELDTTFAYDLDGQHLKLPAFDVEGRIVWGLTHRMLRALFEALDGDLQSNYRSSLP